MNFIYFDTPKTFLFDIIVKLPIILCVGALASAAAGGARQNSLRIVGGRDALPSEFPFVVRLTLVVGLNQSKVKDDHLCTASVLSPTVTLTAAHCCIKNYKFVVRYDTGGRSQSHGFSEVFECIELPNPENWLRPVMIDDLALLRTEPIILPLYARLSALDHHTMYGQRVTILGHGKTPHNGSADHSTLKLKLPLQVLNVMWAQCDDKFLRPRTYPLACVMRMCGQDVALCPGDSGGPVLHSSGVVGVTSRATHKDNCNLRDNRFRAPLVGLFSPLGGNIDWIADRIKEINKMST